MAGLEGGGCRHLKVLSVGCVGMGPRGGQALARALASRHLNGLQRVAMAVNGGIGDEGMAEVIKGLRECRNLPELYIGETGMGVKAGQALVQALQDKAWPKLEVLFASGNRHLLCDEGVVVGLVGVLERRAELCPLLEVVKCEETRLNRRGRAGGRLVRLLAELEDELEEEEGGGRRGVIGGIDGSRSSWRGQNKRALW